MPEINVLTAVRDALREEMARDDAVIVLGEDVGTAGGVFRATEGLLKEFGDERVVDAPLAESAIVGVAIGAAIAGLRPVAEIQFADFIWPAMDQIVNEAAKWRYRTNGVQGCPLVIRAPFGGGIHGGPYHSQCVEAAFFHVPGLKIIAPSTPRDIKGLLKAAIRDPDPVLFFEHKRMYRLIKGAVPDGDYVDEIGKGVVRRPGRDLTVITYGMDVHHCLHAAEEAAKQGVEAEVIDLRTLLPLDKALVLDSVKRTNKALIVHEDTLTGGIGAEIAATIAQEAFEHLDGPVTRLASPDIPAMPFSPPLEEFALPNPQKITEAILRLAAY